MIDDKEERVVCEGCRTGNYWLCKSFPGSAPEHAQREVEFRKRKKRRVARASQTQVFQRDEQGDEDGVE